MFLSCMSRLEKINNIAAKRGFFYPTAEIYGSRAGFWTYGHLGKLIKNKWENLWRCYFLGLNDNYFEIEGSYILPKKVFESSGHLKNFNDLLVKCDKCRHQLRADHFVEEKLKINVDGLSQKALDKLIKDNKLTCPKCNSNLGDVELFNMMFDVKVGVFGDDVSYLLPETAQNPFLSFKRQYMALREKLPMGLAMIGKAFRNEISPRQGFFRLREFTQAELQIFFDLSNINEAEDWNKVKKYKLRLNLIKNKKNIAEISCEDANKKLNLPKFYVYHLAKMQEFYLKNLNIPKDKFRFREIGENERAHYNKIHFDAEIDLESLGGFKEVAGCHFRSDYDLSNHQKGSNEKLEVTINENGKAKKLIPNVLELSFGVDRNIWALLDVFFKEEKERTLFNFPNNLLPVEVAVFPLVNKDKLPEKAKKVYHDLNKEFLSFYDSSGSIGKMYRRMDEIGTKYMITIDHESLKKKDMTIRDRNTMKQIRVKEKDVNIILRKLLDNEIKFEKAGKII